MKVLIIGLGSIAKKHLVSLKKLGINEIYALRSGKDANSMEGVENVFTMEKVRSISPDFVIISNITSKHEETIKKVIDLQIPLFIEKPLFSSISEENAALVNELENKQIITYIACSLRFLDCLLALKQEIKGKRINEINIYSGSYLPEWRPGINYKESYSAQRALGGGVHIDLIHELDYLYYIVGEPIKTNSTFRSASSLEIDAVDYANYIWEYPGFSASVILNYYRRDTKRIMEVVTDKETFLANLVKNKLYKNGEEIYSSSQTILDTLDEQMRFFVQEIIPGKETNFNTAEEAYKILKLCLD